MLPLMLLIAEGNASFGVTDIAPAISSLGSIGFAVWYAWYTTTKSIPDLLASHKVERGELLTELKAARLEATEARLQFAKWMAGREELQQRIVGSFPDNT